MKLSHFILTAIVPLTIVSCASTGNENTAVAETNAVTIQEETPMEEIAQVDNPQVLSADQFKAKMAEPDVQLVDVRTPEEVAGGAIENSVNIDFMDNEGFKSSTSELDKSKPVLVYCKAGGRSARAAEYLASLGFEVYDLEGGYDNWTTTD